MRRARWCGLLLVVCCSLVGTVASAAGDARLAEKYRQWLVEVDLILTAAERGAFLALDEDYRRDAFIAAFWQARDPDPATPLNLFRETYYARREEALSRFASYDADASLVWILNGPPGDVFHAECHLAVWPIEIWYYRASERLPRAFALLFYRPGGGRVLRLWHPSEGFRPLQALPSRGQDLDAMEPDSADFALPGDSFWAFARYLRNYCLGRDEAIRIIAAIRALKGNDRSTMTAAQSPSLPDPEWLATFASRSTDLPSAEPLSEKHRAWLEEVALLISVEERQTFLSLPHGYQREGFIEEFWKVRDTNRRTETNEARAVFAARRETAIKRFGSTTVDPARVYILNGEPELVVKTDCRQNLRQLEIWFYRYSDRSRRPFQLLFHHPPPSTGPGSARLWRVTDGYAILARRPLPWQQSMPRLARNDFERFYRLLLKGASDDDPPWCPEDAEVIINAMHRLQHEDSTIAEVVDQPPGVDTEWLATYRSFSTELGTDVAPLAAELALAYPARHQSRTVVRGTLVLPADAASGQGRAYTLTGEVLREGALHESFRYVFQISPSPEPAPLPLVFDRNLRPGQYHLVLKLEENGTSRALRIERDLEVPAFAEAPPAEEAAAAGEVAAVRLLAPATDLVSGVLRLQAEVGDARVASVAFLLDGRPLLTRQRPPWTVELRVGELPRSVRVRAVASDGAGDVLGADELLLNGAPHRFTVRLLEPREGAATAPLRVRAEVRAPQGRSVDRIELFLDETPLATLYQPPWETLATRLPQPAPLYLRAVAYLADGTAAEDAVLLAGGDAERGKLEVDLVEVYTTVLGADDHPAQGLAANDFTVREDGRPQQVQRFQHVTEVPLHTALLVDTSASMADMLPAVQQAAIDFFDSLLAPGDRAAVLTFSEEPRLAAPFSDDLTTLTTALVGLRAERGTALWDSVVHTLHYFQGIGGRRALVVFSDGADRGSRFRFDDTLAYAQHAGVAIYAVSFGNPASGFLEGRRRLERLAESTGGRAFVLDGPGEVESTYAQIEQDLRSQYLLVYQSDGSGTGFRAIDVEVKRAGHTARAMRGYLP